MNKKELIKDFKKDFDINFKEMSIYKDLDRKKIFELRIDEIQMIQDFIQKYNKDELTDEMTFKQVNDYFLQRYVYLKNFEVQEDDRTVRVRFETTKYKEGTVCESAQETMLLLAVLYK